MRFIRKRLLLKFKLIDIYPYSATGIFKIFLKRVNKGLKKIGEYKLNHSNIDKEISLRERLEFNRDISEEDKLIFVLDLRHEEMCKSYLTKANYQQD